MNIYWKSILFFFEMFAVVLHRAHYTLFGFFVCDFNKHHNRIKCDQPHWAAEKKVGGSKEGE